MSSPVPPSNPYAESRIGIVSLATPNSMFVNVGGTVMEVAFDLPFTAGAAAPPPPGTVVHLVRQDATWIAVGRVVGAGSNSVLNPSFEDSPAGTTPVNWQIFNISGSSVASVVDIVDAPDGDLAARVYSASAADHYLYSSPIPVNMGDIWSLSCFVGGDYGSGPATADMQINALWFANSTDLFPTTSSATIVVASSTDVPQYPPFRVVSGNVTSPIFGFMRVALRSQLNANQALIYDSVIARKV